MTVTMQKEDIMDPIIKYKMPALHTHRGHFGYLRLEYHIVASSGTMLATWQTNIPTVPLHLSRKYPLGLPI